MRRFWLLLMMTLVPCAAQAQTATAATAATAGGVARPSPIEASEVFWSTSDYFLGYGVVYDARAAGGRASSSYGLKLRHMAVTLTNTGSAPVVSVRLAFVFSDPESGEEWFRYKSRRKTRLMPGESLVVEKVATATFGRPARDELAKKSVVVTEVKYADGSVWRRK